MQELFEDKHTQIFDMQEKLIVTEDSMKIRRWMKEELDEPVWKAIECLTDFEIILVYEKVFAQMTCVEIAEKMNR